MAMCVGSEGSTGATKTQANINTSTDQVCIPTGGARGVCAGIDMTDAAFMSST